MTTSASRELRKHSLDDGSEVLVTSCWTIIDGSWSADWVISVQQAEAEVGHSICGWRTKHGTPCKNHPIDERLDVDRIGRCGLHNMKKNIPLPTKEMEMLQVVESARLPDEIVKSKIFTLLTKFAEENYTRCKNCDYRLRCEDRSDERPYCIKEKILLESVLEDTINEHGLVLAVDQMTAFTLAQTFVDYIKTLRYERHFGESGAISGGRTSIRIQLCRLMLQNMRSLGVDRKCRLILKRGDHRMLTDKTLSELLSTAKTSDTQIRDAEIISEAEIIQDRQFIGSDGKEIKDGDMTEEEWQEAGKIE